MQHTLTRPADFIGNADYATNPEWVSLAFEKVTM